MLNSPDRSELLDTGYFHVVFTVPHELNPLALTNPALFYDLLFSATAQTLLEVAANPQHLGVQIGFLSILHTWGQNLLLHLSRPVERYSPELFAIFHACRAIARSTISPIIWV